MNEIDFRINCDRSQIVFILTTQKSSKTVDSNSREYLTFIKVINDEENSISFIFITKDIDSTLHRIIVDKNSHKNITLIPSEITYINNDFALN